MSAKSYIIILSLIASAGIVWQFVMPTYENIKLKSVEIGKKEQEIRQLEEWISKLQGLFSDYQEHQDEVDRLYKLLPEGANIPGILNEMEMANFQSGMILNSIDFSETDVKTSKTASVSQEQSAAGVQTAEPSATPQVLQVSMKTTGSYDAFRTLLGALENSLRLFDTQSINFSSKGEQGGIFDFSISGKMYYR